MQQDATFSAQEAKFEEAKFVVEGGGACIVLMGSSWRTSTSSSFRNTELVIT